MRRSVEPDAGEKKAVVFTVFLALWTAALVDSCRLPLGRRKKTVSTRHRLWRRYRQLAFHGSFLNRIVRRRQNRRVGRILVPNGQQWPFPVRSYDGDHLIFQVYDEEKKVKKAEAEREHLT